MFTSRVSGFFRDVVIANFFGLGFAVDAYVVALRIPNFIRNIVGDAALSASFVPVYSSLLGAASEPKGARRLALGILGPLLAFAGLFAAIGVLAAPWLVAVFASGFDASASALTVRMVRILFPMAGVMIVVAWCLGVLTSHRRFYLPFVAPVLWNLAQIVGVILGARLGWQPLVVVLAWSTLIGSVLQLGVQLPAVRRLVGSLRPRWDPNWGPSRQVIRNAGPAALGQGVFQISSLTDAALASLLLDGALAGLYYAQRLALLPIALFGVSVAVSSLPEMSREGRIEGLGAHLEDGVRRIAYFVIPAAVVLGVFGDRFVSVIFLRGAFRPEDVHVVHWALGAFAIGLLAQSLVKLFASAYHADRDTKTPVRYATIAVVTSIVTGAGLMFWMDGRGFGQRAVAGLILGGAIGAWLNLTLLTRGLARRGTRGWLAATKRDLLRSLLGAAVAAAVAWSLEGFVSGLVGSHLWGRVLVVLAILAGGGAAYVGVAGLPTRRAGRRAR
ncbi:MAG: murein biosynthesis integral membrane protein MurJ [Gemmatimonadetes bacterium]|nr:murein biosynthesis integral membrane protein MurJ [Gemmatimonadota bacterium]